MRAIASFHGGARTIAWAGHFTSNGAENMARLSGKTAAITGGTGGIGAAIAHRFAAEDATLALLDLNGDGAAQTAAALNGPSSGHYGAAIDVSDETSVENAFAAAAEAVGEIDILVSNPAFSRREAFLDYEAEQFSLLLIGQQMPFGRIRQRDKAVHTASDAKIDQPLLTRIIDPAVGVKAGREYGKDTAERVGPRPVARYVHFFFSSE